MTEGRTLMSVEVYDSFLTNAVIPNATLRVHRPSADHFAIIVEGDCIRGERSGRRVRAEFVVYERKSSQNFAMIKAITESQPKLSTEIISSLSYAVFSQVFCQIRGGKLLSLGTV